MVLISPYDIVLIVKIFIPLHTFAHYHVPELQESTESGSIFAFFTLLGFEYFTLKSRFAFLSIFRANLNEAMNNRFSAHYGSYHSSHLLFLSTSLFTTFKRVL